MYHLFKCAVSLILFSIIGCDSVSKYTIDKEPLVKIDTNLLGIWKAKEDTSSKNYFLVQNSYDAHYHLGRYMPDDYHYYITYMNNHGTNRRYENFPVFLSKIKNKRFLNVGGLDCTLGGFVFIKLIDVNRDCTQITTATFSDEELPNIGSSSQLRERIRKNLNDPSFYSDTLHFVKVSNFHGSLKESKSIANQ